MSALKYLNDPSLPRMKIVVMSAIIGVAILGTAGFAFSNVFGSSLTSMFHSMTGDNSMNQMMSGDMMSGGMMSGMMGGSSSMQGMMSPVPEDVIIKVISSQVVPAGKDASIKLLILDKNTGQPLSDAQVIFGIEKGAPMTTMDMQGGMFYGKNLGDGKYLAQFKLGDPGYYTLHTHVIPAGKSMMAMMENHMDIGIIAR
jgi:hypothetical protein